MTHAIHLPEYGGDTSFISLHAAYDGLSPRMQHYLDGLTAVHDLARIAEMAWQGGHGSPDHLADEDQVVRPEPGGGLGLIVVAAAGTADFSVAEEAALVAEALGNRVDRVYDCGVAGLHRLLDHYDLLAEANVIVAVAGMEGALPSVIGGLVDRPVIAVPTSIGYGASFGGIAALLAMLNSCAPGVSVVNIDNGYGAAHQASQINRLIAKLR